MYRILWKLFRVFRLFIVLIFCVGIICIILLLIDEFAKTNITGINDELSTYQWIKENGGSAKRTQHGLDTHIISVSFAGNQNVHLLDLRRLKVLSELWQLDLSDSSADNGNIQGINEVRQLRELNISDTNITDEGLLQLVLPVAVWYNIDGTKITIEGVQKYNMQWSTPTKQHDHESDHISDEASR